MIQYKIPLDPDEIPETKINDYKRLEKFINLYKRPDFVKALKLEPKLQA